MFQAIENEVESRLTQTNDILKTLSKLSDDTENGNFLKIQKGFLFVSFYASIEFTVTNIVSIFLEFLSNNPQKASNYKVYILCTILNSQFNAIRDCSKGKVWDKRAEFMDNLFSDSIIDIDSTVFSSDGINITAKQIRDIWKYFHLSGDALPEGIEEFFLMEIKNHRNAIAHGREKASEIGGRFTLEKLNEKKESVEILCRYIVQSFKNLCESNGYLK
ncbi:MAE_28990/MAE_18760 family HEPN-like nuclease [Acinetobacter johnsonii]|uniref:MAE_28990/MAE_18760 family HEPN-like nuclease n=1 Tax=Acinetobacter johnsonii TaxID=40214 RepID=UPI0024499432|nr:MAE_28990/MAE_18760 family HEPN-like nuclease [Acinetobacter johnsonii]MDH1519330.1 MAE_28990/MAE_18760 family HEPN-like nuclease [Acinetobacter johnsonii]